MSRKRHVSWIVSSVSVRRASTVHRLVSLDHEARSTRWW